MPKSMRRLFERSRPILLNAGLSLMAPLVNALAAWWVIRAGSEAVWGSFVGPMVIAGLALHLLNYGNREYLLRAFARHPEKMEPTWRKNLITRAALLLIVLPVAIGTVGGGSGGLWLGLWVLAGFLRQAFESVIVYRKDFGFALAVELLAAGVLFGGLIGGSESLSGEAVLQWYALAWALRAGAVLLCYGGIFLSGKYPRADFGYFAAALPFFLLGFAGLLLSRTDLYCVTLFVEDRAQVGRYQLLMSFFLYLQAVAGFILLPYVRNLYRLPDASIHKLSWRMAGLGIPVVLVGLLGIALLLHFAYQIEFPPVFFLLGIAFVGPVFYYSPLIYLLFKHEQQRTVVLANAAGIVLNLGLNLALIPSLGILGALIATTLGQGLSMGVIVRQAHQNQA